MFTNMRRTSLLMVLIFFAGLLIGCAAAYGILYFTNRNEYCDAGREMTDKLMDGMGLSYAFQMDQYVFDNSGQLLLKSRSSDTEVDTEWLFSAHTITAPRAETQFWLTTNGRHPHFLIIVGLRDSMFSGRDPSLLTLYYVWNATEVTITFTAFILSYCIIFAMVMVLVALYHEKMAEIENMRRDYVSNVSHELKTPIASIKALTEALSDGMVKDPGTRSRYYGIILNESNRLEQCVLNILELNRLQSVDTSFEKRYINAREFFEPLCKRFDIVCDDRDIRFHGDVLKMDLPPLYTDPHRLNELLEILLENAVKFCDRDQGDVWLSGKCSPKKLTIRVSDNGQGISQKDLPHVFERFYKASESMPGSGLGLAIAKEISERLGEKLWVKSAEGDGASFYVTVSLTP